MIIEFCLILILLIPCVWYYLNLYFPIPNGFIRIETPVELNGEPNKRSSNINYYNNVGKVIIYHEDESGNKEFYRIVVPEHINLHNHTYQFFTIGNIGKRKIGSPWNGERESIRHDSIEGIIMGNIRRRLFKKYENPSGEYDIFVRTTH